MAKRAAVTGAAWPAAVRVLVDASALPADRGGVGRYVDELMAMLPRLGLIVAVAAQPRDTKRYAGQLGAHGVHVVPSWASHPAARLIWEQTGLPVLVSRLQPDVLLSPHYTMPLCSVPPGRAGDSRPGQVVTFHDATFFSHPEVHTRVKSRFFATWIRVAAARADALVVPSQATRDEVVAHAGVDPAKITVIPHGVDHNRFRPPTAEQVAAARDWAGVAPGAAYVAFLGTLEPRKNVPALVQAFADVCRWRPDPPELVLAGRPGWDTALDGLIAAAPSHLRIRRPGFIPDHLVCGLLGGSDVFAYPSLGEGFGLPLLEAMACGVPVLTTRMLSLPEVGNDAVEYAASPAAHDIAVALAQLLDNPLRRAELARSGQDRARRYTWENSARAHLRVLEKAAVGRGRAGRP